MNRNQSDNLPVAEIIECNVMGQQTIMEIEGRLKFLRIGDKLYAQPSQVAQPAPEPVTIEINFKQVIALLEMFGGEPTSVTLLTGKGHSGTGLYAHYTEMPEEGAQYLGEVDEDALPDAGIAQPEQTTPVAWQWLDSGTFRKTLPATAEPLAWRQLFTHPAPVRQPLTDERISTIARVTQTAEPGRDGYILPFSFAREIELAHGITATPQGKHD